LVLGGLLYHLKRLPGMLCDFIERFFIVKLEVLDEDESFLWMQVWLAERLKKTLSLSVITKRNKPTDDETCETPASNKPTVYFVPAVGTYFFWYRGRFVTLNRNRQENAANPSLLAGGSDVKSMTRNKESFTLRIYSRDRDLARQLIED